MTTPIWDFVQHYAASGTVRLHMPGHKGQPFLGCEPLDITEVSGTETLIRESEANAADLFGSGRTVYATGGSSQCVRAMVYLAVTREFPCRECRFLSASPGSPVSPGSPASPASPGSPVSPLSTLSPVSSVSACATDNALRESADTSRPVIVAARNAHKSLLYAAALCDAELVWLPPGSGSETASMSSLWECPVTAEQTTAVLERLFRAGRRVAAVYVTSPDYLGGVQDIAALADAAHRCGVPLLVDNAHGAYLKFLPHAPQYGPLSCALGFGSPVRSLDSRYAHPLDLGADLCCDSAHKTLPVLTGGAYLHIGKKAPASFRENAWAAMELFGSTSPSWLTLASLDLCNRYLSETYPVRLEQTVLRLWELRNRLQDSGWQVRESDPLRLTLQGNGFAMAGRLRRGGVAWEYAHRDFLVLMATPENTPADLNRIAAALGRCDLPAPPPVVLLSPIRGDAVLSPREALFAPQETVPTAEAAGRVCGTPTVSCPPAVPVVVSGERIPPEAVKVLRYYGIETVDVVRESP